MPSKPVVRQRQPQQRAAREGWLAREVATRRWPHHRPRHVQTRSLRNRCCCLCCCYSLTTAAGFARAAPSLRSAACKTVCPRDRTSAVWPPPSHPSPSKPPPVSLPRPRPVHAASAQCSPNRCPLAATVICGAVRSSPRATPTQRPAAATTHPVVNTTLTCRPTPSHHNRRLASTYRACAYTPRRPDAATPDAVVGDRTAHFSTRQALGHGDRQSFDCASHCWRAQTCAGCPE